MAAPTEDWQQERARVLAQARVVVVKVGSAVLTDANGLSMPVLENLAAQLAERFPQSITVHTDDFYLPPSRRVTGWEKIPCANMDIQRLRELGLPALVLDRPAPELLHGHGAGMTLPFARRFAPCLVLLLEQERLWLELVTHRLHLMLCRLVSSQPYRALLQACQRHRSPLEQRLRFYRRTR